jgi:phospholipase/carboxylesterase
MSGSSTRLPAREPAGPGRLTARPGPVTAEGPAGLHPLGLAAGRDGVLYVPASHRAGQPAPLAVMLHGAGGVASRTLESQRDLADAAGYLLLVPESRAPTWDVLRGGYGPDIAFLDRTLAQTFARYAVDPTHVAIGGFSDGASYGLSVGIMNGDLFTHVLAFSPGFAAPLGQVGMPRIFVSHGTRDQVLPIDICSRDLVPRLRRAGYTVEYHEFEGPHRVPPEIARAAVDWFLTTAGEEPERG